MTRSPIRSSLGFARLRLVLAIGAVHWIALSACGHYGPPVRPEAESEATTAPAAPAADRPSVEPERDHDERDEGAR